MRAHARVVVVGAGFAGVAMAARLRVAGLTSPSDLVVLERGDDVGGAWRDNSYPGCACDVPSVLYSLSFAPNPDWSRTFSHQPEIWSYLRRVAECTGVLAHVRLGTELESASWDEQDACWSLETSRGPLRADVLVSATGGLSEPAHPGLAGLAEFSGEVWHTAHWRHDVDLAGRRVGVVGTGASAIQVVPALAPVVGHLDVFQRTPPWVLPRGERPVGERHRALRRRLPWLQQLERTRSFAGRELLSVAFTHRPQLLALAEAQARRHLRTQVPDPSLRARLLPSYRLGCKRILLSDDYYPALGQPQVELVTEPIDRVTAAGVVTADGQEHPLDVLVLATGFRVTDSPAFARVHGRDGRSLAERWQGSPQAHLGTTVTGFPNLFLLSGPHTGLGHTSVLLMVEAQVRYVESCLELLRDHGADVLEVRPEAQSAFEADVARRMAGSVWTTGGCVSWYLDASGRNSTLWPGSTLRFRLNTRRARSADFDWRARAPVALASPSSGEGHR